jgi:hypothetical protein
MTKWSRFDRGIADRVCSRLTDGNGRFEFTGLPSVDPAGTSFGISAGHAGLASEVQTVTVACGQTTRCPDLVLDALEPRQGTRGVVRDRDGKPVGGSVVSWIAADSEDIVWRGAGYREASDHVGRFRLLDPEPGWRLHATAHGYARTILAAPPDGIEATIVLEPAVPFAGRVTDADGKAVARCSLLVRSELPKLDRWLRCDGSGRIDWEDLPPSLPATLHFVPPPRPGSPRGITGDRRRSRPLLASIERADPAAEFRLDWRPIPAGCTLTIKVLDAESGKLVGEPIDGNLFLDTDARPPSKGPEDIGEAVRPLCQYRPGLVRVEGVPGGEHRFWLNVAGYRSFREGIVRVEAGSTVREIEVGLTRGMVLQGRVRRADPTFARGILTVSAETEEDGESVTENLRECCPDAEGRFRLALPWSGHDVQASLRDASGFPLEQSPIVRLSVGDARCAALDFELRPAVRLSIKVDESVTAMRRSARIQIVDSGKRLWFDQTALKAIISYRGDVEGQLEAAVPAGEYDVQVMSGIAGRQRVVKSVRARAPGLVELSLP